MKINKNVKKNITHIFERYLYNLWKEKKKSQKLES